MTKAQFARLQELTKLAYDEGLIDLDTFLQIRELKSGDSVRQLGPYPDRGLRYSGYVGTRYRQFR